MAEELVKAPRPSLFLGMERNPVARQLLILIGIAAAVAAGVAIALWSQSGSYQPLYAGLGDKDAAQVADALAKSGIAHKLDPATGAVLVASDKVHEARMRLASQGLPKGTDAGFELMQESSGFGASPLVETARYQRALEGELARSIGALTSVQSARVHLGLPAQTAFGRQRQPASASVLVNLYPGRALDEGQVDAIVHLVSASVPNLDASRVSVVDQRGRLLTSTRGRDTTLNEGQLEYTRKLEAVYVKRIEELLTPIVGPGAVRAQVTADMDFTFTEQTQEKFNPAQPALRSEQVAQEQNTGGTGAIGGIPGALTNQPPGAASVPETTAKPPAKAADTSARAAAQAPSSSSNRATRNFELDKTISHTRLMSGTVQRLSVAVVVDDQQKSGEDKRAPFKPEDLERLTALVKEVVGFNAQRGDSVSVMNIAFSTPAEAEPAPAPPLWQQPWVWNAAKQGGAVLVVLFLIFGILRPAMRSLIAARPAPPAPPPGYGGEEGVGLLSGPDYDRELSAAKGLASKDPGQVAQVVKSWVSDG